MTDAERDLNMRRFPPGSAAAVLMGCKCDQHTNRGGLGYASLTSVYTGEKVAEYIVSGVCPLHTETPELLAGYTEGVL